MRFAERIVVDTGVLVSAALWPHSVPGRALALAWAQWELCASGATLQELTHVLQRDKFDRYLPLAVRQAFIEGYRRQVTLLEVHSQIDDCRDPADNKFLGLALDAQAALILSSDPHLTELSPWRGVPIATPAMFLAASDSLQNR